MVCDGPNCQQSFRFQCENAGHGCSASPSTHMCRTFASTSVDQASTVQQKRRHRDPYAIAQARARKAANVSRQEVLRQERAAALGDPVRGTSFNPLILLCRPLPSPLRLPTPTLLPAMNPNLPSNHLQDLMPLRRNTRTSSSPKGRFKSPRCEARSS